MNIALILSGGTGTRLGADIPKQYIEVNNMPNEACGRPVIIYCMESLFRHGSVDAVQIVAAAAWQDKIREWMDSYGLAELSGDKFRGFSEPGENRQLSILNALEDIKEYSAESDLVLIHDAARPMLSERQIGDCFQVADGHEGVVPVLPMKDTIYESKDGRQITSLMNRSELFAGQAPEVFRLGKYLDANRRLLPDRIMEINGSAEPAILAEMDVVLIPGEEENFKITTREDLKRFIGIIGDRM